MRYRVKGLEIRTENTAKPPEQASKGLVAFLRQLPRVKRACDMGCGKLRYATVLASRADCLILVDSETQLAREQIVHGKRTTIKDYVAHRMPNCETETIDEFMAKRTRFDFVLCANVLSAIPQIRARSALLRAVLRALTPAGRCLFVTQYRNSYFRAIAKSKAAVSHLDGWLLKTGKGVFYYGLLSADKLAALASRHGFNVIKTWTAGQAALVLGGRPSRCRNTRLSIAPT